MFPADQVLPYMVRNTYRLPPTFFRTSLGTPSRIGPTHPTSVTSVPDLRILTPDTAPRISHDHCAPFIGMGLYAYLSHLLFIILLLVTLLYIWYLSPLYVLVLLYLWISSGTSWTYSIKEHLQSRSRGSSELALICPIPFSSRPLSLVSSCLVLIRLTPLPPELLRLISDTSPSSTLSRTSPLKSRLRPHPSDFAYALWILSPASLRISLRNVHYQAPPWHRVGST